MQEINANARSIREVLSGRRYGIDYFQREYQWKARQVEELVADLTGHFLDDFEPHHDRRQVAGYGRYFLGSIITSHRDGVRFVVDGQQRLTTLSLLLIFLHRRLKAGNHASPQLEPLIFSQQFGEAQFNLDVPARRDAMRALLEGAPPEDPDAGEAVQNLLAAYEEIEDKFPSEEIDDAALPYFADWLIERVYLVEIAAASDEDAYAIFETVNDRGLRLTPTEMLKGYLLARIADEEQRREAGTIWRQRVEALQALAESKEEDAEAIKAWLRSQHADSIRPRKKGARPEDFDRIGTEFHRWVRDREGALGLSAAPAFASFIKKDFGFYTRWYERIRLAGDKLTPGLEDVYANALHNFTLQYPLLLAPLRRGEPEAESLRKVRVVAAFVDILLARRTWAFRSIDYSTLVYSLFLVMKDIRGRDAAEVADLLALRLGTAAATEKDTFEADNPFGNANFRLTPGNRKQVHALLARLTDWVTTRSGLQGELPKLVQRRGRGGFEIEHIWANKPGRHEDEFSSATDFREHRNRIGGLLLLPKQFNASFGDLPYEQKVPHYAGQNMLAKAMGASAYSNNPGFLALNARLGGLFQPYPTFTKNDFDHRQATMQKLAQRVWSVERLQEALGGAGASSQAATAA